MSGERSRGLGRWGERLAAAWLRQQGAVIVDANWRCRFGEIDLICREGRYLCFVEVKLRRGEDHGTAGSAVDARKQEKLRTAAQLYLQQEPTDLQPRFDVVEIYAPQGEKTPEPSISRIKNAF